MYDGGWVHGKKEGRHCVHTYADGGRFAGEMRGDVRQGRGRFEYSHGDVFEGVYEADLKHAGVWHYASGAARVCTWRMRAADNRSCIHGEGCKWSADRRAAWRLIDGEEVGSIGLAEAEAIARRIGFGHGWWVFIGRQGLGRESTP